MSKRHGNTGKGKRNQFRSWSFNTPRSIGDKRLQEEPKAAAKSSTSPTPPRLLSIAQFRQERLAERALQAAAPAPTI